VERFLGPGKATVSLPISDIANTRAIIFRTASTGLAGPEVALLDASAHVPSSLRLTTRRHDLPFDLVAICAPPKTASQTVEQSILALHPSVQVRRVHFLSDRSIARARTSAVVAPAEKARSFFKQIDDANRVRGEIELTRDLGGSIGIVTGVREPIDRSIAAVFQSIPDTLPSYQALHAVGPRFVDLLQEVVIQAWKAGARLDFAPEFDHPFWGSLGSVNAFFKEEFLPLTGIDILRQSIDKDTGFTILSGESMRVLFYRFEDIPSGLARGLSAFLGRSTVQLKNENRSGDKAYAELYREFRKTFKVPRELCQTIYNNIPYVRHFYSESEIALFTARWCE